MHAATVSAPSCQVNSWLKYLNLSWNNLRAKGVVAIADGLKCNDSLLSLNIAWCGMQDAGAEAVGEMLGVNQVN